MHPMSTTPNFAPQNPTSNSIKDSAPENPTTDSNDDKMPQTVPQHPTNPKLRQPDTTQSQPSKQRRSSASITESNQSNQSTQRCPLIVTLSSSYKTHSRRKRRKAIMQQQKANKSIVENIQSTAAGNPPTWYADVTTGTVLPRNATQSYILFLLIMKR